MVNKRLTRISLVTLITVFSFLLFSCNENVNTKKTVVIDSTNIKKNKRVIDTTAESRPIVPGG